MRLNFHRSYYLCVNNCDCRMEKVSLHNEYYTPYDDPSISEFLYYNNIHPRRSILFRGFFFD